VAAGRTAKEFYSVARSSMYLRLRPEDARPEDARPEDARPEDTYAGSFIGQDKARRRDLNDPCNILPCRNSKTVRATT